MQKILIIEDSETIVAYLSHYLEDEYDIIRADNGEEAVGMLTAHNPDCVLSDLFLPEMDGFQFLEYLNKEDINIPVIIMSSDIQDDDRERCLSLGAFAVLNKPVKGDELRETVKNALKN